MKTKKIFAAALAGLCAVSAMGVSAFAAETTEAVKTAGEKSYKISAGFQAPAINVTVPTTISAIINPYMIEVDADEGTYEAEGVASPKYDIVNNSTEIGIKVKATYSADGLDGIVEDESKVVENGKKLAYVTLNAEVGGAATQAEDEDADADTGAVKLVMSTKDTTSDLMQLKENETGNMWIGGKVPEEPSDKWTAKDKLTINVVLDLTPYNTGAAKDEDDNTPAATPDIAFDVSSSTLDGVTINAAKATGTVTIDMSDSGEASFTAISDEDGNTYKKTGNYKVAVKTDAESIATVATNGKVTFAGTGTDGTYTVVLTFTNDVDGTSQDITFTVTESGN